MKTSRLRVTQGAKNIGQNFLFFFLFLYGCSINDTATSLLDVSSKAFEKLVEMLDTAHTRYFFESPKVFY